MIGLKPTHVWDISQTDGDPVPELPRPTLLHGQAPAGLWDGLADQITGAGFELRLVSSAAAIGGANGLTDFLSREVSVRMDMDDAAQVKTLAHELGHVLLHAPENSDCQPSWRRTRPAPRHRRGRSRVRRPHGRRCTRPRHRPYTVPYVSTWAASVPGKTPVEVVQSTAERVRGTARRDPRQARHPEGRRRQPARTRPRGTRPPSRERRRCMTAYSDRRCRRAMRITFSAAPYRRDDRQTGAARGDAARSKSTSTGGLPHAVLNREPYSADGDRDDLKRFSTRSPPTSAPPCESRSTRADEPDVHRHRHPDVRSSARRPCPGAEPSRSGCPARGLLSRRGSRDRVRCRAPGRGRRRHGPTRLPPALSRPNPRVRPARQDVAEVVLRRGNAA